MKCDKCGNEMFIDNVERQGNQEVFNYKCANPECEDYGYGRPQVKKAEE
jgi:hypothetical protein